MIEVPWRFFWFLYWYALLSLGTRTAEKWLYKLTSSAKVKDKTSERPWAIPIGKWLIWTGHSISRVWAYLWECKAWGWERSRSERSIGGIRRSTKEMASPKPYVFKEPVYIVINGNKFSAEEHVIVKNSNWGNFVKIVYLTMCIVRKYSLQLDAVQGQGHNMLFARKKNKVHCSVLRLRCVRLLIVRSWLKVSNNILQLLENLV